MFWWSWRDYQAFLRSPVLSIQQPIRITIEPGQSFSGVVGHLVDRAGLQRPLFLRFYARQSGQSGRVKAGEYDLQPGWTPVQLLDWLVSGRVVQHSMTIVEGLTFAQLRQSLSEHEVLVQTLEGVGTAEIMRRLGHEGMHPEGRFFPDTYLFPRGTTDFDFLRRAFLAMQRRLTEEWEQRAPELPLATPSEALVLASIIEKETGLASERPEIAGVFIRRLRKGMKLETDPTVIYGLGAAFDGNLRRADLRRDTPYNTYTRTGLPPTPIATPSAAALHAALHPAPGTSLFFVAKGDGTGAHHFSATYDEHRRAVRRYQLNRSRTSVKSK